MNGYLKMESNNISGLPNVLIDLTSNSCARSYGIVNQLLQALNSMVVQKSGDTINGTIDMNKNRMTKSCRS